MGNRHIARHAVRIWDWNFTLDQWFQIFVQGRFYVITGFVDPFSRNHLCLVGNAVNWCMAVCDGVWRIGCPFQSDHGGGDAFFRQGDAFFRQGDGFAAKCKALIQICLGCLPILPRSRCCAFSACRGYLQETAPC